MNQLGNKAEQLACQHLQQQGLQLVQKNYQTRRGEIDLIMRDNDYLVFIEVRYRRSNDYGHPAETITPHKQRKIIATAQYYLHCHPMYYQSPCRFDVVAIMPDNIEWIRHAFGM